MTTQIYINLPVTDLARSTAFYEALGFTVDDRMRDENACGVKVGEEIVAISAESPQAVDELADRALAAGGGRHDDRMEVPGMHGRAFTDPDGHQWEVLHTEPGSFEG